MSDTESRYAAYRTDLNRADQAHLLRFWPDLSANDRLSLLDNLDQIDLELSAKLIESLVRRAPELKLPDQIEPAAILPSEPDDATTKMYSDALEVGRGCIAEGQVAAFTVAGGQGTRLGYDGPKGGFKISPIRNAPLFQLFAEQLIGTERRYGRRPPWYIMTSPANHAETIALFSANSFFGLNVSEVMFFQQGQMPAFAPDGRILLESRCSLALSPNGHGGSLAALASSGALKDMARRGIEYISYFQVDNPLVKAIDPLFIGLHQRTGSEMSSKAVRKADDLERVGNFCMVEGKLTVIEYSDLPEALAHARNADGDRRFDAGSIAIHVLNRSFVERLTADRLAMEMPWHRAVKKVPTVDEAGKRIEPQTPNAVKLEMFIFDAIPLARNAMAMYTPRDEEFSPVKNAEGVDSVATARRDMMRRAAKWLEHCGCSVPRDASGEPIHPLEISPEFALDAEDLRGRLAARPALKRNEPLLLTTSK